MSLRSGEMRFESLTYRNNRSRRGVGRPRLPVTEKITGSNPAETANFLVMEELDFSYDINGANMLDMTVEQERGDYKLSDSEFAVLVKKRVETIKRKVLHSGGVKECCSTYNQIFSMKDGNFILEVCKGDDVQYFVSKNLKDLTDGQVNDISQ